MNFPAAYAVVLLALTLVATVTSAGTSHVVGCGVTHYSTNSTHNTDHISL